MMPSINPSSPLVAPVSVVVPCYRCASTIGRAVASVAGQTLRPAELILVNDASPDNLSPVLHALQAQYGDWVRVLELPINAGAASARNAGWDAATQPYVAFLDADDAWHPAKIALQYAYLRDNPDVALCAHLCRELPSTVAHAPDWPLDDGVLCAQNLTPYTQPITWRGMLLRHQFVTPSVMLQATLPWRFAQGQRYMEDHRLWLDLLHAKQRVVRLNIDLVAVYKPVYGASGLSAAMWPMEQAELDNYRNLYKQGALSWGMWCVMALYSLAKYAKRWLSVHFLRRIFHG
jgi:glycosyltransferase involved in cell wall biosynthesis